MTHWRELIQPQISRFEVAAAFNGDVKFNAEGSKAMANLLKEMARIIDDEIDKREQVLIVEKKAQEDIQRAIQAIVYEVHGFPSPTPRACVQSLYKAHRRGK